MKLNTSPPPLMVCFTLATFALRRPFASANNTSNTKKLHRLTHLTPELLSNGYLSLCTHITITRCSSTPRSDTHSQCTRLRSWSASRSLRSRFADQSLRPAAHSNPAGVHKHNDTSSTNTPGQTTAIHKPPITHDRTWHAPQRACTTIVERSRCLSKLTFCHW